MVILIDDKNKKERDMETRMNAVPRCLFDFKALIKALKRGRCLFQKRRLIYIKF